MAESDEDATVKAMLKEWPQLSPLDDSLLKRMSKIRPALMSINQQTPRAELFSLISEINDVARHVGDDQPVTKQNIMFQSFRLILHRVVVRRFFLQGCENRSFQMYCFQDANSFLLERIMRIQHLFVGRDPNDVM